MVRSAAKNYRDVAVVTDPADYPSIIEELESSEGAIGLKFKICAGEEGLLPHRSL